MSSSTPKTDEVIARLDSLIERVTALKEELSLLTKGSKEYEEVVLNNSELLKEFCGVIGGLKGM